MKTETGAMISQAGEGRDRQNTSCTERPGADSSPRPSGGINPADVLGLDFQPAERRQYISVVQAAQSLVLCCGSPRGRAELCGHAVFHLLYNLGKLPPCTAGAGQSAALPGGVAACQLANVPTRQCRVPRRDAPSTLSSAQHGARHSGNVRNIKMILAVEQFVA